MKSDVYPYTEAKKGGIADLTLESEYVHFCQSIAFYGAGHRVNQFDFGVWTSCNLATKHERYWNCPLKIEANDINKLFNELDFYDPACEQADMFIVYYQVCTPILTAIIIALQATLITQGVIAVVYILLRMIYNMGIKAVFNKEAWKSLIGSNETS